MLLSRSGFIEPIRLNKTSLESCWLELQLARPNKEIRGTPLIAPSEVTQKYGGRGGRYQTTTEIRPWIRKAPYMNWSLKCSN